MKAKVQYNDIVGTAAADISDYYLNSLTEYLKSNFKNFDSGRYTCVGCEFYASYGQYPNVYFVCKDNKDSSYRIFKPNKEYTLEDFFEMFKRFSITIGNNIENVNVVDNEPIELS